MNGFEGLLACAGIWEGDNRVQVELGGPVESSETQLLVSPILRNTFLRMDQTWSWKNELQFGSFLIGFNPKSGEARIQWIDTWHNGTRVMPLIGRFDTRGWLIAHGNFPVDDGPDWGWRIEIGMNSDRLTINMFCLDPEGNEAGYVWSSFARPEVAVSPATG